ncbi:hypothetical protein P4S84_26915, partial [Aneurinibacillus aneurinilyticus]|uniref:hypothetical protein n=1 Tax=Aneurinibacillus aneurinilyticus TaxID=1391 RepID=UPI002E1AE639|nr:hypothetical protein [Aneurinibacillus aneurinilyticus]
RTVFFCKFRVAKITMNHTSASILFLWLLPTRSCCYPGVRVSIGGQPVLIRAVWLFQLIVLL